VIVLDNNPLTICFHNTNVFPIKSWFGNKKDTELKDLIPILGALKKVKDVREIIGEIYNKMGVGKDETNRAVFQEYQKYIKAENRDEYAGIMGNYYSFIPEFDPDVLKKVYRKGKTIIARPEIAKPSNDEVNMIILNHMYSNVKFEEINTEEHSQDEVTSWMMCRLIIAIIQKGLEVIKDQ
jgi:hypothetical protein